jgi:hypothetical protein
MTSIKGIVELGKSTNRKSYESEPFQESVAIQMRRQSSQEKSSIDRSPILEMMESGSKNDVYTME